MSVPVLLGLYTGIWESCPVNGLPFGRGRDHNGGSAGGVSTYRIQCYPAFKDCEQINDSFKDLNSNFSTSCIPIFKMFNTLQTLRVFTLRLYT